MCPSVIRTPLVERIVARVQEREAQYLAAQPIGRMGTPQKIAEAMVWLCSDAASFVTGHAFPVDEGFVAPSPTVRRLETFARSGATYFGVNLRRIR